MWTWTLNWNEIRADLVIGSCPMTFKDIDRIQTEAAATAVLSLQNVACHAYFGINYKRHVEHGNQIGLVMANSPMQDFDAPDQRRNLPNAIRSLHGLLQERHRVYVHCTAGINRSPLTVLGYLTWVEGLSLEAALALIRQARPEAQPYLEAYEGCHQDLNKRYRSEIQECATRYRQTHPQATAKQAQAYAEQDILRKVLINAAL